MSKITLDYPTNYICQITTFESLKVKVGRRIAIGHPIYYYYLSTDTIILVVMIILDSILRSCITLLPFCFKTYCILQESNVNANIQIFLGNTTNSLGVGVDHVSISNIWQQRGAYYSFHFQSPFFLIISQYKLIFFDTVLSEQRII